MKKFQVVVTIEADSLEDAKRILSERISPEERYDGIDNYYIYAEWDDNYGYVIKEVD